MRWITFAAAALLLPGTAAADAALDAEEIEFMRLINQYRADNGLPCLSISPTMNAAADYMSRAMGEQEFFAHNEPPCSGDDCTGRDPFDRMRDYGHTGWTTAGENIAAGYPTAAQVFEGWRNSPGHNANMLEPGFTAMGIARVEVPGSPFRIYWTNDFSNRIDGPLVCEDGLPPVGYGDPDGGAGGSGGTGGIGGEAGTGGTDPGTGGTGGTDHGSGGGGGSTGAGGEGGGMVGGTKDDDGTGCASAGGLPLLGLAIAALGLRRR